MKTLSKMIGSLVIAGTILSTGVVALAAGANSTSRANNFKNHQSMSGKIMNDKAKGSFEKGIMKNNIEENLKTLVSAGIITQTEADKILSLSKQEEAARQSEMDKVKNMTDAERKAYFDSKKDNTAQKKVDIFDQAVSNGIINQEKANSAKTKLQESREAEKKAKLTEGLNGLVSSGTITEAQKDKIVTYITTLEASKQAPNTAPATAHSTEKKNPLSALVDKGTLTQAQLDAVSKALPMGRRRGHNEHKDFGVNKSGKTAADTTSSATIQ